MARGGARNATILGWTGRGSVVDLLVSSKEMLESAHLRGRVGKSGSALVVEGPEPASVVSTLRDTPGVQWLAVGRASDSFRGLVEETKAIAKKYVSPSSKFWVVASGGEGVVPSDVNGAVVSAVLEEVRGARVDSRRPNVTFRACLAGNHGAVGVELSRGPGGTPTGNEWATCLVSGGMHSAVVCWMALLSGYRLKMVHAKVDEASVVAAAKIFAELSRRVAPSAIDLDVLTGGSAGSLVNWKANDGQRPVFTGLHSGCSDRADLHQRMQAPLFFAPEEWFEEQMTGLSLKPYRSRLVWTDLAKRPSETLSFGGVRTDVSGVLDGLRARNSRGR